MLSTARVMTAVTRRPACRGTNPLAAHRNRRRRQAAATSAAAAGTTGPATPLPLLPFFDEFRYAVPSARPCHLQTHLGTHVCQRLVLLQLASRPCKAACAVAAPPPPAQPSACPAPLEGFRPGTSPVVALQVPSGAAGGCSRSAGTPPACRGGGSGSAGRGAAGGMPFRQVGPTGL